LYNGSEEVTKYQLHLEYLDNWFGKFKMHEPKFHEPQGPKVSLKSLEDVKILADHSIYPNIPYDLVKHLKLTIREGRPNRFTNEYLSMPHRVAEGLDKMFAKASKITRLESADLLRSTDFKWRDLDPTRIESALAEIRAIFFLDEQGFSDINPLRSRGRKEADLIAARHKTKYAIEVADSYYYAAKRFSSEQIANWIISRYQDEEKYKQLEATSRRSNCQRQVFIAIIDTRRTVALQVHENFLNAAIIAWEGIGMNANLHVCVVTGREALGYGKDDAIYPEWS